ncbi:MAG: putative toxin-antitoxin system toxin component, PIN family [Oscillospiraceae bacterium]|nr:putative toxin-antitoxin system toxin component, PIN family [Oscillospiraceae bacterium]
MVSVIEPSSHVRVCRDPDDNKFIECALDGQCNYIVSGDKDLLDIRHYKNIRIITVSEFLGLYGT